LGATKRRGIDRKQTTKVKGRYQKGEKKKLKESGNPTSGCDEVFEWKKGRAMMSKETHNET